jgi:proteasome lid subunit RPN8/RPN11
VRYTITFRDEEWRALLAAIFSEAGVEGAAYVLCGNSRTDEELRFLARRVIPVSDADYLVRRRDALSIASTSYVRAGKQAVAGGEAILFVHSHPDGYPDFSPQDDREDPKLHNFLADYAPHTLHGSIVVSSSSEPEQSPIAVRARVHTSTGWADVDRIRVLGDRFQFFDRVSEGEVIPPFFDRQVRAFGRDIQRLLGRLHVGVVGAGGTGSAVIEQLTRLGVGRLSVFDGDQFDPSNVNRVYGSSAGDGEHPKAQIAERNVKRIGLPTTIGHHPTYIETEAIAKLLRDCDIVFGCTDDHTSRSILVRLALWYLIPVFDLGVVVDAPDESIRDVVGRVTIVMAGEACLFCRGRISAEVIRQEGLLPEEREVQVRDGYIPPLGTNAPAVITFTTAVAAQAITELLHRLTGFMGPERNPSEVLLRLNEREISTNQIKPDAACQCMDRERWGRGDEARFLRRGWLPGVRHR